MEIKLGAENEMNTFFFSQQWLARLESYSPADIDEVTKELVPEAPYGGHLRPVRQEFLLRTNAEIKNHNSDNSGILKLMGQTTESMIHDENIWKACPYHCPSHSAFHRRTTTWCLLSKLPPTADLYCDFLPSF